MTYRNLNEMPRIVKLKKESPQRRLSLVIMQVLTVSCCNVVRKVFTEEGILESMFPSF